MKDARERRTAARRLVASGVDPSVDRQERKLAADATAATFGNVFTEWLDIKSSELAPSTCNKIRASMTNHALPRIGNLPIASIGTQALLLIRP